jgi:hypothetical protein
VKLVLLKNDVDVAFKLSIFNFEKVEILFKLVNIVLLVAVKLVIKSILLVDNESTFELDA